MPQDPSKNINQYKIAGGELNEFEFHQNQQEFVEQQKADKEHLIPGTPPEQQVEEVIQKAHAIVARRAAAKEGKQAKKSTKKAPVKTGAKKSAAKKATKKSPAKAGAKKGVAKKATKKTGSKASKKGSATKKSASKKVRTSSSKKTSSKKSSRKSTRKAASK